MSDYVISHIRTYVPIVVGAVAAWLVTIGIDLTPETQAGLIAALTGILQAVYYAVARALAQRWPWAESLLGVGRSPSYEE